MQRTRIKTQSAVLVFCLFAFCLACGSVPTLESAECTQGRDTVKRFYSFHFGNDMQPSAENLAQRKSYLTPELFATLSAGTETKIDYFTATDSYPKAFRIGSCTAQGNEKVSFQIVLFWKDDTRSEQKEVKAELVRSSDVWLISKVTN